VPPSHLRLVASLRGDSCKYVLMAAYGRGKPVNKPTIRPVSPRSVGRGPLGRLDDEYLYWRALGLESESKLLLNRGEEG